MKIDCPLDEGCVLFHRTLAGLPDVAMLMKARYCDRDRQACALRTVAIAIGPENVPEGFYPNQSGRAEQLIKEHYIAKTDFGRRKLEGLLSQPLSLLDSSE